MRLIRFALALRAAMKAYPSQRIGQLVSNAGDFADYGYYDDSFYIEDDDLTAALRRYAGASA